MQKPIVNKLFLLEKYEGKGGWTYAVIPEVVQSKSTPFGWVTVSGSIDGYELKDYRLMPMGNGQLFLPVKAEIRKRIGKQAGDWVKVILFAADDTPSIPADFMLCLRDYPAAEKEFLACSNSQKRAFVRWIYSAKSDATREKRMAEAIALLDNGVKDLKITPKSWL